MSDIALVEGAYVFPPGTVPGRPFTICDQNGAPVPQAQTTIKHSVSMPYYLPEEHRASAVRRPGTYLFGGIYLPHFGHFMLETLSRLWALDHVDTPLDGVIFLHFGRNPPDTETYREVLDALGLTCPILILTQATQFDRLLVPCQGLGMGPNAAGRPEQRVFLRERLSKLATSVDPHKNVYISRSAYKLRRGGMLGEGFLQKTLSDAGYHVFHPQKEPLGVQIGTYLAAERVVAPDSSALHLFAFVADPCQSVAIILRRKSGAVDLFPQLSVAMEREPLVIDAIKQTIANSGSKPANWGHYAELDFDKVYTALVENGFLKADARLSIPKWKDLKRELDRAVRRTNGEISWKGPAQDRPELTAFYF